MKTLTEIFNIRIKKKKTQSYHLNCKCSIIHYFKTKCLVELRRSTKKKRALTTWTKAQSSKQTFQDLVTQHFKPRQTYFFILNAHPNVYNNFQHETTKRQYKLYLHVIKKALRGKPYKNTNYQVYPEYGDKNGKFHCNLLINLEYYPYVKDLANDLRCLLTPSSVKYKQYSCTLPRTYGRKPCHYAYKDAHIMSKLKILPFIK